MSNILISNNSYISSNKLAFTNVILRKVCIRQPTRQISILYEKLINFIKTSKLIKVICLRHIIKNINNYNIQWHKKLGNRTISLICTW